MYAVHHTYEFEKELTKYFSNEEQKKVANFEKKQLAFNPYVGDPLGYTFLREKKLGVKRVYYLIYEEHHTVFLVKTSDKKQQQDVIDEIKSKLALYYQLIKEIIKQRA